MTEWRNSLARHFVKSFKVISQEAVYWKKKKKENVDKQDKITINPQLEVSQNI